MHTLVRTMRHDFVVAESMAVATPHAPQPGFEDSVNAGFIASLSTSAFDAILAASAGSHRPSLRPPVTDYPVLVTQRPAGEVMADEGFSPVPAGPAGRVVTPRDAAIYAETERWAKTIDALVAEARSYGLTESEVRKLESILRNSNSFDADAQLLREVMSWNNRNQARALRTFNDLDAYRRQHPDRITPDIVRALALGVAEPRIITASTGLEGILGNAAAINAAEALVRMPPIDYQNVRDALDKAGTGFGTGRPAAHDASAQKEQALILKAVGARVERLADTTAWNATGDVSPACEEVTGFATAIRGKSEETVMTLTSAIDLMEDGEDTALQQRWTMSCGQAALQIARAEADPVYALQLHAENLHSTSSSGAIAAEQKEQLEAAGGVAVARYGSGEKKGTSDDAFYALMNRMLSPLTGRTYEPRTLEGKAQSRAQALDYMEQLLKTGTDVPISFVFKDKDGKESGHMMLVTDARWNYDDRRFLVTDPGTGKTVWISSEDLVNGNTKIGSFTGTLESYWW